jgi:phage host-nuclease inhibitor protein Gam
MEDGHADVVIEQLAGHFRALEKEITTLKRDVKLLQDAERDRLTDTGVVRILDARNGKAAIGWTKWGIRAALLAAGSYVVKLAWKGLHAP